MMKATIDGKPLDGAGTTLSSALEAALVSAGERMVIEAVADGAPVPGADLESPPARDPYASEIQFLTAEPRALIKVTLHDAADHLQAIAAWQTEAGNEIQSGRIGEAMPIARRVLEGWQGVREAVDLIAQSGLLEELGPGDSIDAMSATLIEKLGELKRDLGKQDWASVSDVLAYDLGDEAERWRTWLRARAQELDSVG